MAAEFRYEIKYLISEQACNILHYRLNKIMSNDVHTDENGNYCIRSLYFDDDKDAGYYENINGVDPRKKYRLRFYVGNSNLVKLEMKEKIHSMTKKTACSISEEQVAGLLENGIFGYDLNMPPLLKRFYYDVRCQGLKPKIIVEYDRTPYIYNVGNVRVTIDKDIRASSNLNMFRKTGISFRPVMPIGMHILEVKYDYFLPDFVRECVFMDGVIHTDYSKYCMCRKYQAKADSVW